VHSAAPAKGSSFAASGETAESVEVRVALYMPRTEVGCHGPDGGRAVPVDIHVESPYTIAIFLRREHPGRQRSESDMDPSNHRCWQFPAHLTHTGSRRPTLGSSQLCAIACAVAGGGGGGCGKRGGLDGPVQRGRSAFGAASIVHAEMCGCAHEYQTQPAFIVATILSRRRKRVGVILMSCVRVQFDLR